MNKKCETEGHELSTIMESGWGSSTVIEAKDKSRIGETSHWSTPWFQRCIRPGCDHKEPAVTPGKTSTYDDPKPRPPL